MTPRERAEALIRFIDFQSVSAETDRDAIESAIREAQADAFEEAAAIADDTSKSQDTIGYRIRTRAAGLRAERNK